MVECLPSKQVVAGSNPVSRSKSGRRPAMLSLPISMPVIRRISPPHMVSKPSPSSSLRRTAAAVNARRYVIAGVCLLIAAGALRFYNLSGSSLWHDEAIASLIARGTLSDVVINAGTRYSSTMPALYPMALWAVQKAQISELSIRLASATASLLTVGALLFWMPLLGVPRRAAFLAALLATASVAAIEHARDGREYSADALLAALLIAGTLRYLRDGRRALLCVALFAGPLLQYGLIVFGVGALGAAAFAPGAASRMAAGDSGGRRPPLGTAIWGWLKRRVDLLPPVGAFAAGCALAWGLTARHQYAAGGWGSGGYLAEFYHQIGYGSSQLKFAGRQTWDLLGYHMPPEIAAAALIAFGAALLIGLLRRGSFYESTLFVLMCFTVGAAIWGGVMNVYPYGGSRHNLYLGPIVFLAMGGAFHWAAVEVSGLLRRAWVGTALAAAVAVAIAVAGAATIRQADVYRVDDGIERVLAALDERKREGDAVYVSRPRVPVVEFYKDGKPADYFYGKAACWGPSYEYWAECFPEMVDEMFKAANNYRRIWFIHNASVSVAKEMAAHSPQVAVEEVDLSGGAALRDRKIDIWTWPQATLQLISGFDELSANIREEWLAMHADIASAEPSAVSTYNLYLRDNELYYAKRPCDAADTDARFFLHIYPRDAADLPDWRRRHDFDNLDFDFQEHGLTAGDMCLIRRALPGYAIERIHAGQFVPPNGAHVWEAELAVNP